MRIWLINHYAGNQFFDNGGRHYNFAKYLKRFGHDPVIFCCNAKHNSNAGVYFDDNSLWHEHIAEGIDVPFVFVRGRAYVGNGKQRVLNMIDFYRNVKKTAKEYAKEHGKPDVILASSVHPLTLVAGIQLAKYFGVKCICEVRDLWPESIVAYSSRLKKSNPIIKLLYAGEKWIYKKADHVIMTWAGGFDYIKEQGWANAIPETKVTHISNGVDKKVFEENSRIYPTEDEDFYSGLKIFTYVGSIRKVNNIGMLVEAAEKLKNRDVRGIKISIYGDGDELSGLKKRAEELGLNNLEFKGRVKKQCIPYIIEKSYVNILHNSSSVLDKYGQSQNKFFEYLAAGRPILMTYSVGYSVVKTNNCGIELDKQSAEAIADAIQQACAWTEQVADLYGDNARKTAEEYDFAALTEKLIEVIENV